MIEKDNIKIYVYLWRTCSVLSKTKHHNVFPSLLFWGQIGQINFQN